MVMEGNEIPNGWPLGLGNMNSRIRVARTSQVAAPPQPYASLLRRSSSSFSSFLSSNLDTESTASFFPDPTVSLGWLIGIRPANKGSLYCERDDNVPDERSHHLGIGVPKGHTHNSQGICVPLLHHVIGRMSRSGSGSSSRR